MDGASPLSTANPQLDPLPHMTTPGYTTVLKLFSKSKESHDLINEV